MQTPEFYIVAPCRVCDHCRFRRPESDYVNGNTVCKFCSEAVVVQEARQARLDKAKGVFDRIVSEAGIEKGRYTLDDVIVGFIDELGGLNAFLTQWAMQLREAMDQKPGSKVVLDQFKDAAKLLGQAERLRHEERVIDLKDEELELLKQRELKRMIGYAEIVEAKEEVLQAVHAGITPDDLPDEHKAFSVENVE